MGSALIILGVLVLLAIFLPVKRKVLAEGVFDHEGREYNFRSGREDRVWWFRYPCRTCWTRGCASQDSIFSDVCSAVIKGPWIIPRLVAPGRGESIKITCGLNIFGNITHYTVTPTTYKEEFLEKELLEPGEEFLMREYITEIRVEHHHRLTHEPGQSDNCIGPEEIVRATREAWSHKAHPVEFLLPERKAHAKSCGWCREVLLLNTDEAN